MVDYIELIDAMADTLRRIPDLVEDLAGSSPDSVIGYVDLNPDRNSVGAAIYGMKPGTVMVVWIDTLLSEGDIEGWVHHLTIYVRALRGQSPLSLIVKIVNGVPDPGDGMRWRFCPVLAGCLPTTIPEISRLIDEEGLDYYAIQTETKESGDA